MLFYNQSLVPDILILVGGDGTLNAALSRIVNSRTKIFLIPTGTGNDFARELNLIYRPQLDNEFIKNLTLLDDQAITVWRLTAKVDQKLITPYFINYFSLGYDGAVIRDFSIYRKFWPKGKYFNRILYALIGIKNIVTSRSVIEPFEVPQLSSKKFFNAVFCNIKAIAGIFYSNTTSRADDLQLEFICSPGLLSYLKKLIWPQAVMSASELYKFNITDSVPAQIDGEYLGEISGAVQIEVVGQIRVIKPVF